jgi:AAA+ ATPase superfamily predicted ATPase
VCIWGRRRLGKSRLLQEALRDRRAAYFVGDERDAALQRRALAREMSAVVAGMADVTYSDWDPLLARWWREAPRNAVLALDEFPDLVRQSPELPSVLQKYVDRRGELARHVVLCGSSQRMMQGLVLDGSAPLYGRASELIRAEPLGPRWIGQALRVRSPEVALEHYAVWGGVPRYWELAREHRDRRSAMRSLILDPLGVLHLEPDRLLRDDMEEVARAASILALIGQGCQRVSEIGGRLGVPATSLSRPLARLVDLGFVNRQLPFGRSIRDTKRTYYRIEEPFLCFWYRFVDPNRSRLAAGQMRQVLAEIDRAWPVFFGQIWEDLARRSVASLRLAGSTWLPAGRWWGGGLDGKALELDIVATSADEPDRVLVGEAKLHATPQGAKALLGELERKASRCPELVGKSVVPALWVWRSRGKSSRIVGAARVVRALP